MLSKENLKILFVSAEVSPFAKTGGLADVAGSLPQTLASKGNDVRVVMPRYKCIETGMTYITDFPVQMGNKIETCIVRETIVSNNNEKASVPVYFIDSYQYFDRDGIYCFHDDGDRFAFFCNAVLEMLPHINFQPDVIHCNDWHTGPICMLLKEKFNSNSYYEKIATVYTIHNLEYQGNFDKGILSCFNIGEEIFQPDKVEFYGRFNFMKAGLVYADIISTVSETYAKEIQTEQFGEKLEGLLERRSNDLYGIVNGIGYDQFSPETDPRIFKNFNEKNIKIKKENKYALQNEMGLPKKDVPMLSLISRLTGQKGLGLIVDKIDEIMSNDVQFVLLGTGDPHYEDAFRYAKEKYPDKVAIHIGFNASLAQRIYASSDIFVMPSRFEPCGLGQIISLRYGTIPVVRAVGGLADTIIDYDLNKEDGNGFSFSEFSANQFYMTLMRAIDVYTNKPKEWQQLVKKAIIQDFTWNKPADKYLELFKKAINKV
jgi:starch synthase